MSTAFPPRLIIDDQQIMVVLDTSPVRELAHESDCPDWVCTFEEMSNQGYSFSLGVVDLRDQTKRDWVLKKCDASDVWGIGRRMSVHLEAMGICTAWQLAHTDAWTLRKKFSVVVEKTARELAGTTCLELDEPSPPKKEICCSRMFGQRLTDLAPIREAVSTYASRAAEKLRAQQSLCKRIRVSIRTGMFNPDEAKYASGVLVELPYYR